MATLKRVFTLRLNDEVFDKIERLADREHRSMTNLIEYILLRYLAEYDSDPDRTDRQPSQQGSYRS